MIATWQLVALFPLIGLLWFLWDRYRYAKYPPGPPRLPLVGNLLQLVSAKYPAEAIINISKKYGDIVHIKMGVVDTIAFIGFDTVHEILNHGKTHARPFDIMGPTRERNLGQNVGIIWGNGDIWQANRRFAIRTLRDFGFGKSASMDVVINNEYEKWKEHILWRSKNSPTGDGVFLADNLFGLSLVNALWRLVTGVSYSMTDPKMKDVLHTLDKISENAKVGIPSLAFPFIWNAFPEWSGKNEASAAFQKLRDFAADTIKEHRSMGNYMENPECYVDVFLKKIEDAKVEDPTSIYNDTQLVFNLLDLFAGGSESSSNILGFTVLYMILYPEAQKRVQAEIDREITTNSPITHEMRNRLTLTHATLLECYRFSSIFPFPGVRAATEDFEFRGYFIKKDTPLLINLQSSHFSKSEWGDPHNFRPERFLKKDGSVDLVKGAKLVVFGGGRKHCFGQGLGEASTFIYFASMLRDFTFVAPKGHENPTTKPRPGFSQATEPFLLKANLRR